MRQVLCLGAHCDDIEIGCGGLLQNLPREASVRAVVFSGNETRVGETHRALELLAGHTNLQIQNLTFNDGFFRSDWAEIKRRFEKLKTLSNPDLILTHTREDLHQDHQVLSELTWNTYRDNLIFEYEILKYDDDLGSPSVFLPISEDQAIKKAETIVTSFVSQGDKTWMTEDAFLALLRVRGVQCQTRFAEAFCVRKFAL